MTAWVVTIAAVCAATVPASAAESWTISWRDRVGEVAARADIKSVRSTTTSSYITTVVAIRDLGRVGDLVVTGCGWGCRYLWEIQAIRTTTGLVVRGRIGRSSWIRFPASRVTWRPDLDYIRVIAVQGDFTPDGDIRAHQRWQPDPSVSEPDHALKAVMRAGGAVDGSIPPPPGP